jgi:hypothetical protein
MSIHSVRLACGDLGRWVLVSRGSKSRRAGNRLLTGRRDSGKRTHHTLGPSGSWKHKSKSCLMPFLMPLWYR